MSSKSDVPPHIDEELENKAIVREYRKLLRSANISKGDTANKKLIRRAFDVAKEAHRGVRRKSGEAYIFHPLAVAQIVAQDIGLGTTSIICALLHDVVEDTDLTIDDIRALFGDTVAKIIDGLTKIEEVFESTDSLQAENFRKIILTLADDVRVILIKLADRLHNMRTLEGMRKDKQLKIASETLYFYAPMAHRLGLYNMKSELEDLSLKYKTPHVYNRIVSKLEKTKAVRTRFINRFTLPVRKSLEAMGMEFEVKARTKSVYSIYNKMRRQNIPFEEVYDIFAIRIIVKSSPEQEKAECWKIYSVITDFYQPNPDRLRDWISTPKGNGYESLHTTVMSPTGKWVEVQIRSERMDEIAEKGYAAHWKYKGNSPESGLEEWIARIRELLETPNLNAVDFVDDFKLNLFVKEIFVFTPSGDIKSLPHRATALDFAYEIHTDLGNSCIGAKVNGKLVPISYPLNSGDQVEIITSKAQNPQEEWLEFLITAKAKSCVKDFIRHERKKLRDKAKKTVKEQLEVHGISYNAKNVKRLMLLNKFTQEQHFYQAVVNEYIDWDKLDKLVVNNGIIKLPNKNEDHLKLDDILADNKKQALVIGHTKKLKYQYATCCNPIPGDEVVGVTGDASVPINLIVSKEIKVAGTHRFHEEFAQAVAVINSGEIDLGPLVSHTYDPADIEEAYATASDRTKSVKVHVAFAAED